MAGPLPLYQMLSGLGDTLGGAMREYGQRQSLSEIGKLYQAGDMKGAAAKLFEMGDVNTGVQLLTAAQQREADQNVFRALGGLGGVDAPSTGGVTTQGPATSGPASVNAPANLMPIFAQAGTRHGISPEYLTRTAQIESNFNPSARNQSSSAGGLFQFTGGTAKQYGLSNPMDPVASTEAAAKLAEDNARVLRQALGRMPTDAELYLAHQQGAGGAAQLLRNPNTPAIAIVGRDAVVNNGGRENMTAGEFASLWLNKFGGAGTGVGRPVQVADASGGVPASAGGAPTEGADVEPLMKRQENLTRILAMPNISASARAAIQAELERTRNLISRSDRQTELQFRRQDRQDNLDFRRQESEFRRQQLEETRRQNDPQAAYAKRLELGKQAGLQGEELTAYALSGKAPTAAGDKPPNIDQANAAGFADRMRNAESLFTDEKGQPTATINALTGAQAGANRLSGMIPLVGNALQSEDFQRATRAKEDFISAVLRKESGAAISEGEFAREDRKYFPQPGDKPSVLADKAKARQIAIQSMERSAGPALKRAAQPQQASSGIGALLQKLPPERLAKAQKALELGASEAEILQALGVK